MWDTISNVNGGFDITNGNIRIFLNETMGVAQMMANSYNIRDGYIKQPDNIYEITETDGVWIYE